MFVGHGFGRLRALDQLAGKPFGAQGRSDLGRFFSLRKSIG
jgi:hypothetical protein